MRTINFCYVYFFYFLSNFFFLIKKLCLKLFFKIIHLGAYGMLMTLKQLRCVIQCRQYFLITHFFFWSLTFKNFLFNILTVPRLITKKIDTWSIFHFNNNLIVAAATVKLKLPCNSTTCKYRWVKVGNNGLQNRTEQIKFKRRR